MGDGGYNPYDNRDVEKPLSTCEAFMTLLKCVIGTGILSMPLAFKYCGIIGGVVMTTLCTALVIYGMQLLIKCMIESSRRNQVGYMNFPETMVFSFSVGPKCCQSISKGVSPLVDIILCIAHYGVNVVYHVFVSIHFKELSDIYITTCDLRVVCAIVGLLFLPLFLVRQLKYLVPFSIIANILIYLSLCTICYYMFRGLPNLSDNRMLPLSVLDIPIFVGIVMFATSSVGVMLAVEAKMAKPALYLGWFGILSLCAVFVCLTNMIFGFLGYWRYGDNIAASVTINLPGKEIVAQLTKLGIALAVYFTYPLSGYVPIEIIMNHYLNKNGKLKHPHMIEYIIRIAFVIVITLNAIAFPNLGPLVALVGAFAISLLNLIFPCCIEMCLLYHDSYGRLKWILIKNILMIIFGMFVLCYGSYSAIRDMVQDYSRK
ncbi:glutamate transporter polyphemus-like [Drosophila montana]|uniref:glutamate transporter polyphemus-like n=1 Tax=Drosophila montana TaxID=40370 RepID=UPI00313D963F